MKIRFAPLARQDLRSAVSYLLDRNPMAAAEVKNQVIDTIQQLAGGAFEGPETQLRSGRWVRGWPVPPYRVLYRRGKDVFDVVRIYDQRRRPITK